MYGNRDVLEEDTRESFHGDLWNGDQGDHNSDSSESGTERNYNGDDNGTTEGIGGVNGNNKDEERDSDDNAGGEKWNETDNIYIYKKTSVYF